MLPRFPGDVSERVEALVVDGEPPPEEYTGDRPADAASADPVFVLVDGVPYVRGWADAEQAARVLRAELAAWGMAGRVPHVRAEPTVGGAGVVELGRVNPTTAVLLAALLAVARDSLSGDCQQRAA